MKVVVVGGGPAGYVAAIRAAQLGAEVTLVEEAHLGGECTNWACVPSKALLHMADVFWEVKNSPWARGGVEFDWREAQRAKDAVVAKLRGGIEKLLAANGVEVVTGKAEPGDGRAVRVGEREVRFDSLVLATGSLPAPLPGVPFGRRVLDTRRALALEELPKSLFIVGGGAAGVELAVLFAKLGAEVHLAEAMDRLLPAMDKDLGAYLESRLRKLGVKVYTSAAVEKVEEGPRSVKVHLRGGAAEVEYVVVAVGRRPNPGPFAKWVGDVAKVDEMMWTGVGQIYAAGDVAGPPYFAHKAYAQGKVAAENAAGRRSFYVQRHVPSVVFTDPEVVSVGYTEEEARRAGYEAASVRVPMSAIGRAWPAGGPRGL